MGITPITFRNTASTIWVHAAIGPDCLPTAFAVTLIELAVLTLFGLLDGWLSHDVISE
ncbi:MAG: hypothetical protein KDA52_20520 [Planctomycetaceae bacterium]|nr:hypothetical protein [Planctomycetaceae bacterium]